VVFAFVAQVLKSIKAYVCHDSSAVDTSFQTIEAGLPRNQTPRFVMESSTLTES
jgi:hypothetical protein